MAKTESSTPPRRTPKSKLPKDVLAAVEAALDRKALDVVVMDLHAAGAFTDYFIVCTGQNARQVQAIADAVEASLKARKLRPSHVEGYDRAEWVLVDYFDFIVHVFTPGARNFYGLERLWGDAVRLEFNEDATVKAAVRTTKPS
jgi:ribosome-associated protein